MRIILTRHGETEENILDIVQGHLPGKLTKLGIEQAKKLAERLKDEKIDYIYSSDLARSVKTTEEIIKYHPNVKVEFVEQLRERNAGRATGFKFSEINLNDASYDAESVEKIYRRARDFFLEILAKHSKETVLVVGHAGINKFIRMAICSDDPTDFKTISKQSNTAVSIFEVNEDGQHNIHIENCSKHLQ